MADPWAHIQPVVPSLIPIPAFQTSVCRICRSSCGKSFELCGQCEDARSKLGELPAVLPISLVHNESPLYAHLRDYKQDLLSAELRRRHRLKVAALLAVFVRAHADCIGAFDSVSAAPSLRRTAIEEVLQHIPELRDRYNKTLLANPPWTSREVRAARYGVNRVVNGERILLIDDTFASGATCFSAWAALRDAGATVIGPIVIGRFLKVSWPESAQLLSGLEGASWNRDSCIRCTGGVDLAAGQLF